MHLGPSSGTISLHFTGAINRHVVVISCTLCINSHTILETIKNSFITNFFWFRRWFNLCMTSVLILFFYDLLTHESYQFTFTVCSHVVFRVLLEGVLRMNSDEVLDWILYAITTLVPSGSIPLLPCIGVYSTLCTCNCSSDLPLNSESGARAAFKYNTPPLP